MELNKLAQEEHVSKGNRGSKIEYLGISMFKMQADEMTHRTDSEGMVREKEKKQENVL